MAQKQRSTRKPLASPGVAKKANGTGARTTGTRTARAKKGSNSLRIIGGEWRGRKLSFPDQNGLRPTPDRVRETLFNWLQMDIAGARCLDLFTGSGALGLEALSRGATQVTMVDNASIVIDQLRKNLELLKAENADLAHMSAEQWLTSQIPPAATPRAANPGYDIVFLDPPFRQGLLANCIELLEQSGRLADTAKIYVEVEQELQEITLPEHWQQLRQKRTGQVNSFLFQRQYQG